MEENKTFKVPAEGSLGLLALGHRGLVAWRKAKQAHLKAQKSEQQKSPKKN